MKVGRKKSATLRRELRKKKLLIKSEESQGSFITIFQKIMSKNLRDFHQLQQIDTFSPKHLIYIGFLAIDFIGEPIDRTTLLLQFLLDHTANVNILHLKISTKHSMSHLEPCKNKARI
jgi:hypothetical protein